MNRVMPNKKAIVVTVIISLISLGSVNAQGIQFLQQPFDGIYRITSYLDHRTPNYSQDNKMYVFNGEEHPDCSSSGSFTGPFCYDGHDGVDYALGCGTPVKAAAGGIVSFVGSNYGNTIEIDHGNGYTTFYGHLQSFNVSVDDQVKAGEQIALSGNTGISSGCHLHFGVYHNGNVVDPFGWTSHVADPIGQSANGEISSCLWRDGQCFDVIVEDGSYRFSSTGSGWNWSISGNSWTQHYVYNSTNNPATAATYRPNLPHTGPYAVFAFIPSTFATTTSAKYRIRDKDIQNHLVTINQSNFSEEWEYLGTYSFAQGISGYVRLDISTGEPSGTTFVGFDSIRFRQYRAFIPLSIK